MLSNFGILSCPCPCSCSCCSLVYIHRDRDPVAPNGMVNAVSVTSYWISKKDFEPVIQLSKRIVYNERPCALDPSECVNPTCPYSSGKDHMEMRYLLLLRLY